MSKQGISRRMALAGAGVAAAASTLPVSALAATEIDAARKLVGQRYTVGPAGHTAVLEEVVPLSPTVRPPLTVMHRTPFAAVFRLDGEALADGTYGFSADGLVAEPLMVSAFTGADGQPRLEAVFN
ncbi:MAG: hypothetical protein AAGK00_09165 [Pseudomonadota bacterium]